MNTGTFFKLSLLTFLASCLPNEKVKLTVSEEKAILFFIDVNIAEQALSKANFAQKDSLRELYKKQIGSIHELPFSEIEYNLSLVQKDPVLFKKFNEACRDSLTEMNKKSKKQKDRRPKSEKAADKKN